VSAWLGILIVVLVNVVAVAVMLFVRARAPDGGYYNDTQQAGWVYSVAGTSFAVILAFVFLLAFQSFDRARTDSSAEAQATSELFHTAELFPAPARDALQPQLLCYARSVIHLEWPAMRDDRSSPTVTAWLRALERTFAAAPAGSDDQKRSAAYDAWFSESQQRQDGRQGRLDQAAPFVPPLVWFFLLMGGALVIAFVWLFADRSERTFAQAALPVGVATIVTAGLVLVAFFDQPYASSAAVMPTSMERVVPGMTHELTAGARIPCDAQGRPT
jgi:uncharacterized membrane protein